MKIEDEVGKVSLVWYNEMEKLGKLNFHFLVLYSINNYDFFKKRIRPFGLVNRYEWDDNEGVENHMITTSAVR